MHNLMELESHSESENSDMENCTESSVTTVMLTLRVNFLP